MWGRGDVLLALAQSRHRCRAKPSPQHSRAPSPQTAPECYALAHAHCQPTMLATQTIVAQNLGGARHPCPVKSIAQQTSTILVYICIRE